MSHHRLTRRGLLRTGLAVGAAGSLPWIGVAAATEESPELDRFVQPVLRPRTRTPDARQEGAAVHELTVVETTNEFHPDLPATTVWAYDGDVPGPVIETRRNRELRVRFDNGALPAEHLFAVDDRVGGTEPDDYDDYDGPVPEVRTVTHFHGANVAPESDGQADQWTSPGGVEGPGFEQATHVLPNRQPRTTSTYHDHALGISRLNNYAGLHGFYVVRSRAEERLGLPGGEYDVPLLLQDRAFEADGSLHYPESFEPNVAGNVAVVNGTAWPYMEVEPRRYRLRLVNQANGRTFALSLSNADGGAVPTMHQVAPDQGFLDRVAPVGPDAERDRLVLAPFERAEVVVDFSGFADADLTLVNDAEFPYGGGHDGGGHGGHESDGGDDDHGGTALAEVMQFRVRGEGPVDDDSTPPGELTLPAGGETPDPAAARTTRHMTMGMKQVDGLPTHVLNGKTFHAPGVSGRPQLGTTEVWELENGTMHTHPIHLHLVTFRVLGRGPNGTAPPGPGERGPKDVVRVNPGETVRIAVQFGDHTGRFPWHCHVLEHEEQAMMRPFEVVAGEDGRDREDGDGRDDGRGS